MKNNVIKTIFGAFLALLLVVTYIKPTYSENVAVSRPVPTVTPTATPTPIICHAQAIICMVNTIREQNGLPPVIEIQILDNSSLAKANDLNTDHNFSHTDSRGRDFTGFIKDAGWTGTEAENLASMYDTDQEAITAWMNSPEHRANILQPNAIYAGYAQIGIYRVMHFGGYH